MSFVSRCSLHHLMPKTSSVSYHRAMATASALFTKRPSMRMMQGGLPQTMREVSPKKLAFISCSRRNVFTSDIPAPLPLVCSLAPDFTAKTVFPGDSVESLTLSSFRSKKYVCLFFWPMDFTFVCPSEILAFQHALEEFEKRNVQVLGVSTDSIHTHLAWRRTPLSQGGIGAVDFPMISDHTKSISMAYRILHNDAIALRGLFLIDKEGIIRHSLVNDLPLGRSVQETLRLVDALQHTEKYGEVCPANWQKGEKAMEATLKSVSSYLGMKEGA
ncbi:putative alkyl hydroperoxide reductase/ Thiol specific antioxidant/ Mal allergen [Cardiosporidium cionae]|uniref:Alkyl hydroperoxide reductase/ Thiol specific antioxidant/ Mal allergen n=1 Tax=Cardiosporidium cionae TaxID=476202 RepID=A0ABQ7J6C0_9APIC|nr:putative alkyl hydroperoxide reductase/ Thiol specific antioxidant/ Mal allergen [Cardiosporidium cionae]|eukprot:KAF8819544.1 putative alkyl hydroperoxide reductase/ Thiol specific antioxidant/ Mal allergen [Cardiosporidium cionae]